MRLLKRDQRGKLTLTKDLTENVPSYAILSHTWGEDHEEVTFDDLENGRGTNKAGYTKLQFCGEQAAKEGLEHFWVDTCCINKANLVELDEAIRSMFRWYESAASCYVYLSDVSVGSQYGGQNQQEWESDFRKSRWFTRGWTLQELLAPNSVGFFSREGITLGNKKTLERMIHEITDIPTLALQSVPMSQFTVEERLRWAEKRKTKRAEDKAYCLLGIFDVFMPLMYGEGEHAYKRLREEMNKRSGDASRPNIGPASTPAPEPTHWLVTRPRNALFTGRDGIVQELVDIVEEATDHAPASTPCRIVISGMGGQGKSEICLQLAHRLRPRLWGVFWIDVSSPNGAERSFVDLAHKLSVPARTWEEARLGIGNLQHPWLLVLDNADDPDPDVDYQQYIPDSLFGVVIMTSRNEECQQYATAKSISLEGLAKEEARDLLLRAAHIPPDQHPVLQDEACAVAGLLQSHPLALIQAGAYISRGHCTLGDYPEVFKRQRQRLLGFRPRPARSRYGDVYATFEASAELLKAAAREGPPGAGAAGAADVAHETAQDALELLPLLAMCGPSRLPLPLFEAAWTGTKDVPPDMDEDAEDDHVLLLTPWHVQRLPSFLNVFDDEWDSFRVVEAVQLLKSLSLVSVDRHSGYVSVSMHPLIYAWARDRQDRAQQHESWLRMGCVMAFAIAGEDGWGEYQWQLQPHVETLTGWDADMMFGREPVVMVSRVLMWCGWKLLVMGADTKLFKLMNQIFTRAGLERGEVRQGWTGVYEMAGENLSDCGQVREAVALLETVVKMREQTLKEDDPNRLTAQHNLAKAYQANGQVREAVALLETVVKMREQTLKEDDPSRLTAQHNLAKAYQANGQAGKAVALLETVVKMQEQTLKEDDPNRLTAQHNLADAYEANGQVGEAVALLKTVVEIREQTLKEDHPDRLASEHNLAVYLWKLGHLQSAHVMLARLVEIYRRVLSDGHPIRQTSEAALKGLEEKLEITALI